MVGFNFHPLVERWFRQRFGEPTPPQLAGWPHISRGEHTLIAAPTGSGKTLAAFLVCLDRLFRRWLAGDMPDGIDVVYLSPLKALSNDIQRNLQTPLQEICELAIQEGLPAWPIRVAVRTGDTPAAQRQAMLRKPPHILVTTPESLYLLLTSQKSRDLLRTVSTVIVDEIHALARDKRGSHLSLSLERLTAICDRPPTRIGLSATQKPLDQIGAFLVGGQGLDAAGNRVGPVIIDGGHVRNLDLALVVPPSELQAVCSGDQWGEVYDKLIALIQSHRSTLIFVNTRRMAERVAHSLTQLLGDEAVASHHGSLAKEIRLDAEQRLKAGELKAIVATASLEMGIDIGYIDLVCQIGSPRSIATFLQRIGRSGHNLGATPKGRLFPLTRDELLESLALIRAVRTGQLDQIEIPQQPLDILAQQIVATVASDEWEEDALFELCRGAWPYRNLPRTEFDAIIKMLSDGLKPGSKAGAYLHRDQINNRLKARRHARIAAITCGGAIPELGEYKVIIEGEGKQVGTVDEDFAIDSTVGNIFLLGNTSWRITQITRDEVIVADAGGAPPNIPFWFGEAPGRTMELSQELSNLRRELATNLVEEAWEPDAEGIAGPGLLVTPQNKDLMAWLMENCGACSWAAEQAIRYVAAQRAALGTVPTCTEVVFERFFDESGGMQLIIHAPMGARINRAWGLAMRKRFCRSFDFELQAAADDNGVLLSIGPQHSFAIESLFGMLHAGNAQELLEQAVFAVPMFGIRWRWNITRALGVLRSSGGKRVPPFLQKYRAEDLLAATFPETVGCLENHHGDIEMPDHPLVRQTMHDCLHEAMDLPRWLDALHQVKAGTIKFTPVDTREPSPFAHQLLNARPYAFLDDAPLEERRTRAVTTRRGLAIDQMRDLARLDPAAIAQVTEEAWPFARDADEVHDILLTMVVLRDDEAQPWQQWLKQLAAGGRVYAGKWADGEKFWFATERWPLIRAAYPAVKIDPPPKLPAALDVTMEGIDARVEVVRGRIAVSGPVTATALAAKIHLEPSQVFASFESIEGQGSVMRGRYSEAAFASRDPATLEWCDRRLLARIHRLTLDGLRRRIQPVAPEVFVDYLTRLHGLTPDSQRQGEVGIRQAVTQLQGFELAAGTWEDKILSARVSDWDPSGLDHLFLCGELAWGRFQPPKRDEDDKPLSGMTRVMPITLALREDLAWLLPPERTPCDANLGGKARDVIAALQARGALFQHDLRAITGLLPTELDESLRECAAAGLVSADTFAAVRAIAGKADLQRKKSAFLRRHTTGSTLPPRTNATGRWSLFPGVVESVEREVRLEKWCRLLLARYGVVFRDLLAREVSAPAWWELVRVLRRLELRGEIRGGRFIAGIGEQYALESAVSRLRELRDAPDDEQWCLISAVDPLNLSGHVTAGPKIPAMHKNCLILQRGRCVAAKISGRIEFYVEVSQMQQLAMRRSLQLGYKVQAPQLAVAK
ncbi:ATP-dependent DNA helicase RecQ [Anatilimnocola aggregata]|uniref:ATP-dependent DNA helicase RecQ n=1 Tax=Anatilimnocola aggregata TaxID=2528021 RepID=A0A517YLH5_9BACT|nr:DEAD/DEAH box helicase [Anatilimnocola aggregata]QDU31086.1 ATP-dependent DNA helicase RecQ [Anatilimnocola aggregata]